MISKFVESVMNLISQDNINRKVTIKLSIATAIVFSSGGSQMLL